MQIKQEKITEIKEKVFHLDAYDVLVSENKNIKTKEQKNLKIQSSKKQDQIIVKSFKFVEREIKESITRPNDKYNSMNIDQNSLNNKMNVIIGKSDNDAIDKIIGKDISINLNRLKSGECKIDYRFTTDIDKSTFIPKEESKDYGKNKEFFYINGINTNNKDAKSTAVELSKLTGQNVKAIHNETNGMIKDLLEVSIQRLKDKKFDDVTKNTASNFYDTLSSGKELKIIAHSQGAAITADALILCKEMLKQDSFLMSKTGKKVMSDIKNESKNIKPIHVITESTKVDNKFTNYKSKNANNLSNGKISSDFILNNFKKPNGKISSDFILNNFKKPNKKVDEIMSKVEVITLGGASSQDKFPDVKLVQVTNPKDPVPQVGGDDLIKTKKSRKLVSDGNVSYVKNNTNVNSSFSIVNTAEHVSNSLSAIKKNIPIAVLDFINGENPIDYHLVDKKDNEHSYLNQNNVKSLIYNFGRSDY